MSDNEGATKKSGYRLEYASSARSKCKGAKPCTGTPIPKGAMRMGSIIDFKGNTNFAWRHWGCTTPRIITNMKAKFSNPEDLDGFEDLNDEDKARVRLAWEQGHVADEDVPPTARKPAEPAKGDDDEEKPKKKRVPAKKKTEAEGDDEEKPKKKRATKPKKTEDDAEDEDGAEDFEEKTKTAPVKKPRAKKREGEEDAEKKGTSRRQLVARKTAPRKKVARDESEISGEDFADELADLEDEEDDDDDESTGKKRKRPAPTKQGASKKPRATTSRAKKSKAMIEEEDDDDE